MHCVRCFFIEQPATDALCQRCSRNFTSTERLQVAGLAALGIVLARFSYYLFTGDFFSGLYAGSLFGPFDLSRMLTFPVRFADYPFQFVAAGLMLALVFALPALTAVFYGPRAGLVVAAASGLFALPAYLFLFTGPAALLVGTRFNFRLSPVRTVVVGLCFPFTWFVVSTLPALWRSGPAALLLWLTVAVGLALTVVGLFSFVRRRDFQGSILLKLTGIAFVLVLAVFWTTVGFDTVEYAPLRERAWALGPRFATMLGPDARHTSSDELAALVTRRQAELEKPRRRSLADFQRFIHVFPRSRFTPLALYEMAELHNMKLRLAGAIPVILRIHTDRVTPEAAEIYERIISEFVDSLSATRTRVKLGDFAAQHGQIDRARRLYEQTCDMYLVRLPAKLDATQESTVFARGEDPEIRWRTRRVSQSEAIPIYLDAVMSARDRLRFLTENSDYCDIPLTLFLQVDPQGVSESTPWDTALEWFPDSLVVDNILWERALAGGLKTSTLESIYEQHPSGDVAPRILLHLAARFLEPRHADAVKARKYYELLQHDFPDSEEAAQARRELPRPAHGGQSDAR